MRHFLFNPVSTGRAAFRRDCRRIALRASALRATSIRPTSKLALTTPASMLAIRYCSQSLLYLIPWSAGAFGRRGLFFCGRFVFVQHGELGYVLKLIADCK